MANAGNSARRETLNASGEGPGNMGNACAFCHLSENSDQRIIFGNATVLFLQNEKEQGALLGSGVIIPVRHAETLFDLTQAEVCATFELLKHVKAWMEDMYHPVPEATLSYCSDLSSVRAC